MRCRIKAFLILLLYLASSGPAFAEQPVYTLRVDYHYGSLNPWLFYEIPVSRTVGWLSVFQMSSQGFAQIDFGPDFHLGQWQLIPQIGFEFSESQDKGARMSHLVYEAYAIYCSGKLSFESWNLYFSKTAEEQTSFFYYRDFFQFPVLPKLSIGPQVEGYAGSGLTTSTYLGGQVSLDIGIGSMSFFGGRERKIKHSVFRMTFLKTF
ncbi:MAG TPA: hypothetical protein PK843_07660 [bacterium]|nr:hypothetical protein [bacterium]HPN34372.1 hypothetical protein [bacterium]